MKKFSICALAAALLIYIVPSTVTAATLIPVGQVIGLELSSEKLSVAAVDEAAGAAGLKIGDQLISIDDCPIRHVSDIHEALERAEGAVVVTVLRNQRTHHLTLHPQSTPEGLRLGVSLRRGITGIGTVTWYNPENQTFGALGHGVSNSEGKLLPMTTGSAYKARVLSVKQGKQGQPGQLQGGLEDTTPIGTLERNTAQGIFGTTNHPFSGTALETATPDQIRPGAAKILSTVSGTTVQEYDVEIVKIYPANRNPQRNLLLKITDLTLLKTTGGIVQGMSGSPIIQNGKLVGAVTHVLVNDPTTGYGIFIDNMLDAAA